MGERDIPSNHGENGLKTPMINVTNHTNFPDEIRAEEVVPCELPKDGWYPRMSVVEIVKSQSMAYSPFPTFPTLSRRYFALDDTIVVEFAGDVVNDHADQKLRRCQPLVGRMVRVSLPGR